MSDMFEEDLEKVLSEPKENKVKEVPEENSRYRYSIVSLPSGGKLGYPEEVEYRDIMVSDEKVLSSSTEKTFGKTLNGVLKTLLKDKSFFNKMSIYDRDFLLIWIWANNYSTTKTIETKCPTCEASNTYIVDLTELEIKDLDNKFKNPYPYTTVGGEKIKFRLLTTEDEEVSRKFCNMNKTYDESFVSLCLSIELKTVMPLKEKLKHIEETFTGKDMSIARGFHRHFKFGVNDIIEKECSACGEVSKIAIPFQVDFFIPSLSDDFR